MQTYAAPLYEGTFSVGLDKKFIPMKRDGKPAKGSLRISIQPFLLNTPDKKILFDTGIGEFGEGTSTKTILNNLAEHGLNDFDITDIFCSHLHFDHLGGLTNRDHGYWELTFPDAKIWVSREDWHKVMSKGTYYDDEKTEFIHFIDARADIHFLSEHDQPYPELEVRKVGGHSEFHQAFFYRKGEHKYLMAGDVLPTKGHVNQKFAAKYDFDPKQSIRARQELAKMAYDEGMIILAYHSSETPMFRLTDYHENQGYTIESVTEYVSS
ncbi:MAG TPA: MBL fold metallo-hydrolase [Balneolales bacterium]|nr:MBL fold metallo-hydrolase [Balneolales bacterium]